MAIYTKTTYNQLQSIFFASPLRMGWGEGRDRLLIQTNQLTFKTIYDRNEANQILTLSHPKFYQC